MTDSITANERARYASFLTKFERLFSRFFWVIPVLSFGFGWASFVLVQRGESLAQVIAFLALVGWFWILAESFVTRRLFGDKHPKLSSNVANFFSQSIQQEIYFFSLPFLFAATQWESIGQVAFTVVIVAAAFLSTIDPWYEKYIYKYRPVSLAFHALCSFVSALVILPIVVKLPTEKTLIVALGFLVIWLVLIIPSLFARVSDRKHLALIFAGLCALPLCIWLIRASIPPAGLQATSGVITTGVVEHEPIDSINNIAASSLANGVYAHVAIKAPRGLDQEIGFKWSYQGESEIITASITGGREEGYRTYSMKSNFPDPATGVWKVDVLTAQGQLLQRLEFTVNAQ